MPTFSTFATRIQSIENVGAHILEANKANGSSLILSPFNISLLIHIYIYIYAYSNFGISVHECPEYFKWKGLKVLSLTLQQRPYI
jgi:hypothetical protein